MNSATTWNTWLWGIESIVAEWDGMLWEEDASVCDVQICLT